MLRQYNRDMVNERMREWGEKQSHGAEATIKQYSNDEVSTIQTAETRLTIVTKITIETPETIGIITYHSNGAASNNRNNRTRKTNTCLSIFRH